MKPFYQQESVMNAALNHYFHDHDDNPKKVCFNDPSVTLAGSRFVDHIGLNQSWP